MRGRAVRSLARGSAAAGDKLPSVRELARDLAINPNTIARAYQQLQADLDRLTKAGIPVDITFRQGTTELGL